MGAVIAAEARLLVGFWVGGKVLGTSDRELPPAGETANGLLTAGDGLEVGVCVTAWGLGALPSPRRLLPEAALLGGPAKSEDAGGVVGTVLDTSLRLAAGRLLTSASVADTGTRVLAVGVALAEALIVGRGGGLFAISGRYTVKDLLRSSKRSGLVDRGPSEGMSFIVILLISVLEILAK